MSFSRIGGSFSIMSVAALFIAQGALAADQAAPAKAKPKDVKSCSVCHKPVDGQMRAFFDDVAMRSHSIQLRLDDSAEVVTFDQDALNIVNGAVPGNVEKSLRAIKKGHEVRVAYVEGANGIKSIGEISIKPAMKVPAEKQLKVEQVEKLVSGKERSSTWTPPSPRARTAASPSSSEMGPTRNNSAPAGFLPGRYFRNCPPHPDSLSKLDEPCVQRQREIKEGPAS